MVQETVKRITEIEKRAAEIIESAEKDGKLSVSGARKNAEALIEETLQSARREALALIEQSRAEAEKEKIEIERKNLDEIEHLRKKAAVKLCR